MESSQDCGGANGRIKSGWGNAAGVHEYAHFARRAAVLINGRPSLRVPLGFFAAEYHVYVTADGRRCIDITALLATQVLWGHMYNKISLYSQPDEFWKEENGSSIIIIMMSSSI